LEHIVTEQFLSLKYIGAAIVYSALGVVLLILSSIIFDKVTPGDMWKEIVVEKNLPLAIATGAMILAMGQIIASAIHG
jgi:putative membrane protein